METFIWNLHTQSTEYPEGFTAKLGNSYEFAAEPTSVDQRVFKLYFKTMRYYTLANGTTIDATQVPVINMAALEAFYKVHRMWKTFLYPHPVYGTVQVKFRKPLMIPQGIEGGGGAVQPFGLEFTEQP